MIERTDRGLLIDDEFPHWRFCDLDPEPLGRPRRGAVLVRRLVDGATFEASNPGYPDYRPLFTDAAPRFFFRELEETSPRFWLCGCVWRRTGRIWRPKRGAGQFEILARSRR